MCVGGWVDGWDAVPSSKEARNIPDRDRLTVCVCARACVFVCACVCVWAGAHGAPRGPTGPHGAPRGPTGPHGPLKCLRTYGWTCFLIVLLRPNT